MQVPEHRDISNKFGVRAKQRMNQYPSLSIYLGDLAVVIRPIEKLTHRRVTRTFILQFLLYRYPFFHRVQSRTFSGNAGHIELGAVVLIEVTAVGGGQFDPPFLVHPYCVIPSEHPTGLPLASFTSAPL